MICGRPGILLNVGNLSVSDKLPVTSLFKAMAGSLPSALDVAEQPSISY